MSSSWGEAASKAEDEGKYILPLLSLCHVHMHLTWKKTEIQTFPPKGGGITKICPSYLPAYLHGSKPGRTN